MLIGKNYRLYTFVNFYLSSIQQGIQTAHVVSELFNKYIYSPPYDSMQPEFLIPLNEWTKNDKTIIVLNGGMSFDLRQNYIKLESLVNQGLSFATPYTFFQEDHNALGINGSGVVTAFGIILPEQLYDVVDADNPTLITNLSPTIESLKFTKNIKYNYKSIDGLTYLEYEQNSTEAQLIDIVKSHSLAR
jgi:hypothetical protein